MGAGGRAAMKKAAFPRLSLCKCRYRSKAFVGADVEGAAFRAQHAVDIVAGCVVGGALVDRWRGAHQGIVAAAGSEVVDELGRCRDGADRRAGLQRNAAAVAIDQVVFHRVGRADAAHARVAEGGDGGARVVIDDVVDDVGVVDHHAAGRIAAAEFHAAAHRGAAVAEHRVVGDHHVGRGVPQVDAPGGHAVDDVVVDMAAQVRVVDALHAVAGARGTDIVHHVADDVVIAGAVVGVDDAGAAVAVATARDLQVVHVVAFDAGERAIIQDTQTARAGDIEADDVDVAAAVTKMRFGARADDLGGPLGVRDEADAAGRGARLADDDVTVAAGGNVDGGGRLGHAGRLGDGAERCLDGAGVAVAAGGRDIQVIDAGLHSGGRHCHRIDGKGGRGATCCGDGESEGGDRAVQFCSCVHFATSFRWVNVLL